jgi:hypothetical protein
MFKFEYLSHQSLISALKGAMSKKSQATREWKVAKKLKRTIRNKDWKFFSLLLRIQLSRFHFIVSFEAGFLKPTSLRNNPPTYSYISNASKKCRSFGTFRNPSYFMLFNAV